MSREADYTVGVIGSGGRETSTAAIMNESDYVSEVIGFGSNPGFDRLEKGRSIVIDPKDTEGLAQAALDEGVDVLLVGPELPIVNGVVDKVLEKAKAAGKVIHVLAPHKANAIEESKIRQRELWESIGLNEFDFWQEFGGNNAYADGIEFLTAVGPENTAIKPDGLTGGKGVVVGPTMEVAREVLHGMLSGNLYGVAGKRLLIEQRGNGPEVSATKIFDGNGHSIQLYYSQDHKRLLDSEEEGPHNPNTGGTGAYAPVPDRIVPLEAHRAISVGIDQTAAALAQQTGKEYKGFWYETDMLEFEQQIVKAIKRLEVNIRGGDPETPPLFWLMKHAGVKVDELLLSAAQGNLSLTQADIPAQPGLAAVTIVGMAENFGLGDPVKDDRIRGLDGDYGPNVHIDLAGVREQDGEFFTNSGRVLEVTVVDKTYKAAAEAGYDILDNHVNWRGMHIRRTIAAQAILGSE